MAKLKATSPPPSPFLEVRAERLSPPPGVTGLCVGYEEKKWRETQFAGHVMKWLPEFALKHSEALELGSQNAVELLAKAAKLMYSTDKFQNRGEFGELLLHVALRQRFETVPAISKFFYKDAANDTVKGFDAVHVVVAEKSLELWLGEVKFYDNIGRAIADVIVEIEKHLERDYLRGEFAAITNKIDEAWPHAGQLKKLLHNDTSLDKVFNCVCIPALLTYDSDAVGSFVEASEEYVRQFEKEVLAHSDTFRDKISQKKIPNVLRIHLFLLPLLEKRSLVSALHEALKRMQAIQP